MMPTVTLRSACIAGASVLLLGALIGYAAAEGAPTSQPLFYGGLVTSKQGMPLSDTHSVSLNLFAAQTGGTAVCSTPALAANFTAGRFRIALPSGDNGCAQAVAKNADTWVELTVDDTTFPRAKVGAMPYAIVADHATTASSLVGAQSDDLAALKASVSALQAQVAALSSGAPTSSPAGQPTYHLISDQDGGCTYDAATNAHICNCAAGEIAVAGGGWAGLGGTLNASRHFMRTTDTAATPADRARSWTVSCLDGSSQNVRCQFVDTLCLKFAK